MLETMAHPVGLVLVMGTRPEVMKLYSVIRECVIHQNPCYIIHTGQHYDFELSEVFFDELQLPRPDSFLGVGSGTHGKQTGEMLSRLESMLQGIRPHCVLAVGDTNSVLATALICAKSRIPFVHLEAGVRSFDMTMPEEINRRVADSIATICLAPTQRAMANLKREGREANSFLVGDTLVEACRPLAKLAVQRSRILDQVGLQPGRYAVLTLHRSENVDFPERLVSIVAAMEQLQFPILYPVHPRAGKMLHQFDLFQRLEACVRVLPPLGYLDFLTLLAQARLVLTDSGGVQQEASILDVPCLTLRYNTEWIETVEAGKNLLIGTETWRIVQAASSVWEDEETYQAMRAARSPFCEGAAQRIMSLVSREGGKQILQIPSSDFLRDGFPAG
jgi:UDP-N-acetylglucosamine 2-epimerase (non-hydrolysing)